MAATLAQVRSTLAAATIRSMQPPASRSANVTFSNGSTTINGSYDVSGTTTVNSGTVTFAEAVSKSGTPCHDIWNR